MKTIFAICGVILIAGGVFLYRNMHAPKIFGDFINAPKVSVLEVIEHPENYLHKTVSIEGDISGQCTSMGCYFFFNVGNKQLRIDIAPVAMHAPKGQEGKKARVEGRTVPYDKGYQFSASAVEFLNE